MTATTIQKHPSWGKTQPYELARKVASQWGAARPADPARGRDSHSPRHTTRFAKARGYAQKIRLLNFEPALTELVHEAPLEQTSEPLSATFNALKERWLTDTAFASATVDIVLNDAYQQIIGLGPAVLPLILKELEQNGGQWFWALRMITRQDPVPKELRGKTKRMAEAWIDWAKDQKLI